jgi:hypothetical protein
MNRNIEKWLTIAALAGWIASIGSLIGLAVRATPPAAASRPVRAQTTEVQRSQQRVSANSSRADWAQFTRSPSSK